MRTEGRAYDLLGSPLGPGTPIRTFVDGVEYANASRVRNALGDFSILTDGNWVTGGGASETPEVLEGPALGDAVLFAAGEFTGATPVFQEVVPWQTAAVVAQDLHLGSSATTPEPVKIQGIVAWPARGGDQVLSVCNPTSAAVSLADYYLEVDRPGTYHGPTADLSGVVPAGGEASFPLGATYLTRTGDAVKLVFRNPDGANAAAAGLDIVVDRVEFNASEGGTLSWEPGNTILPDVPAPGPGRILERAAFCGDTNTAGDFRIGIEPGLPPNGVPSVRVSSPAPGQSVPAGRTFVVGWTMSDDLFSADTIRVWVNASWAGTTSVLLAGTLGATSVPWNVPDLDAAVATITVDVADPFGARASDSVSFRIARPDPFAGLGVPVAILIAVVLGAFVVWGYLRASRRMDPGPVPPRPPPSAPAAPPLPRPPETPAPAPPEGKKICPRCATAVLDRDWVCFFCGYRFPGPP